MLIRTVTSEIVFMLYVMLQKYVVCVCVCMCVEYRHGYYVISYVAKVYLLVC